MESLIKSSINGLKHFRGVHDVQSVDALSNLGITLKNKPLAFDSLGKQKRMGLIFLNPSLRTRLSTQIAAENLGMQAVIFNVGAEGWTWEFADGAIMNGTSAEHIKDAAPILGSYFDLLGIRSFPSLKNKEEDYNEYIFNNFIKYVGKPVINLESATVHPLQSLADVITIKELSTDLSKPKVVLTWAPHIKALPQCVANSFAEWMVAWQKETNAIDFTITHPKGMELDPKFSRGAKICYSQVEALQDADFVYVKNWSSYSEYGKILEQHESWMLNKVHLSPQTKVMHCLPVRRNVELSDSVLDNDCSIVTQQAANRVWSAQAVLHQILL